MSSLGATQQTTRYSDCYRHIEHVLGGPVAGELTPKDIVDEAGFHLVNLHPWKWLAKRSVQLELRPKLTFTSATWTEATKTLSSIDPALTSDLIHGDTVEITGGTGATAKIYEVDFTTTPTTTSVVLKESIGSGADGQTDIVGNFPNNLVELPTCMRDARSISATDAVINGVRWTTPQDLLRKRTSQVSVSSSWNYYSFINYVGDPPRPALEMWPTTTDSDPKAFTMYFREGWVPGASDDSVLPIPPFMRTCMFRLCRIFALGYEEGDEKGKKSLDQLLFEFSEGPILKEAMARDGAIQPTGGPMRGGAVASMPRGYRKLLSSEVDAPTALGFWVVLESMLRWFA